MFVRGPEDGRWRGAAAAGGEREVVDHPSPRWGLAARGARVEAGAPAFAFALSDKDVVWADEAPRLYAPAPGAGAAVKRHASLDPALHGRLAAAVHRRHDALRHTAGLNEEVFDALVLLAAGSFAPDALARGWDRVQQLVARTDTRRRSRLEALGVPPAQAAALSELHTRNFM